MRTFLITGSSRGIGRAVALAAAKDGANVVINYNKSEAEARELESIINAITGAIAIRADVGNPDEVKNLVKAAKERFGKIDVLVNNAGISLSKLFTQVSDEEQKRLFDVNLLGTINTVRAVLPDMIERKCGRIINISSVWGEFGASCEVHYSAAKAAIIGFTKALSKEVGLSGVTVNCVAPGCIDTEMNAGYTKDELAAFADGISLGRLGKPEEVAASIMFLASDKANYITGQTLSVNGGY